MDIDLRGVLLGTKHGIRTMLECGNGGAIVNWSSIGGLNASPYTGVYSAAKSGVIAMTKVAAVEYGGRGIRVNAVCPGVTMSPATKAVVPQPIVDRLVSAAALRTTLEPEDMTGIVLFLASDDSTKMTGQTIINDAGTVFAG